MPFTNSEFDKTFSPIKNQHDHGLLAIASMRYFCRNLMQHFASRNAVSLDTQLSALDECIESHLNLTSRSMDDLSKITRDMCEAAKTIEYLDSIPD